MNRRRFLRLAGLGCGAALLGGGSASVAERGPIPDFPPREEAMDPGPLRPLFTQVDGLRMHALVSPDAAGAGAPAIVLVHGSGLSHRYMIPTARALTPDFRVFVPDIPGYGDSEDPGAVLDVPQMADWLAAWMRALGLSRAALLGNSFGCQVIADLAARHRALVGHALLQGPTTPPEERTAFWQFVRWRQNQRYNPAWLGEVTDDAYRKAGAWRLLRSFRVQITDRMEDKMPRIRAPVLVIRGQFDPISNRAFCELLVQLCPRGRLQTIPDVAHTLVVTAPAALAEATRAFVLGGGSP